MPPESWIRINGAGHAYTREVGCPCQRCQTVKFAMDEPPHKLGEPFRGWDDPPWRAHTSASILLPDEQGNVKSHILIDAGVGVCDSLACSRLSGLENNEAILITHGHGDHIMELKQFFSSMRRVARRQGTDLGKVPVYCTPAVCAQLRQDSSIALEIDRHYYFHEISPGVPFEVGKNHSITFTALEVAHGTAEGAVIYSAEIGPKKVVFCWDIDVPEARRPSDNKTNLDVITENLPDLVEADLFFIEANTWQTGGTGHTSYIRSREYLDIIKPRKVFLTHLSGHEDGKGNKGYGWTDTEWENALKPDGVGIARQGMLIVL